MASKKATKKAKSVVSNTMYAVIRPDHPVHTLYDLHVTLFATKEAADKGAKAVALPATYAPPVYVAEVRLLHLYIQETNVSSKDVE